MQSKEKLFSITASDFEWSYTKGSGAGGQKRNKTSSAVHCSHLPSGASGYSEASRSQIDNKRDAWLKCIQSSKFQKWIKYEMMRKCGILAEIDSYVEKEMKKILIEGKDESGRWIKL